MLKLKYLVENFDLARFALTHWQHDEATLTDRLQWFRISSNAVYPFDRNGQLCFLRLSPAEEKIGAELMGEIDFLTYLNDHDYPAMRPLPTETEEYLLLLDTPWGKWYACAFEGVPGRALDDMPMTDSLAEHYGAALGQLHDLSMQYRSPVARRNEQDVLTWVRQTLQQFDTPGPILEVCDETLRLLSALPRDRARYGLIHYDFEPDNVFWDGETCSVIDFEDGMMHFYDVDLVQALDELPESHHAAFLCGYQTACPAAAVSERDFPLMRCFRDLYAYARLLHCLSEKPVPEPDWMPPLTARLEHRRCALESSLRTT